MPEDMSMQNVVASKSTSTGPDDLQSDIDDDDPDEESHALSSASYSHPRTQHSGRWATTHSLAKLSRKTLLCYFQKLSTD
jgi:hypothetical protein